MELQLTSRNCHKPYAFREKGGGGEGGVVNVPVSLTGGAVGCHEESESCVVGKWRRVMVPTASRWSIIGRMWVRLQAKPCAIFDEQSTSLKQVSVQVPGFFPCHYHSNNVPYSVFICQRHCVLAIDGVVK